MALDFHVVDSRASDKDSQVEFSPRVFWIEYSMPTEIFRCLTDVQGLPQIRKIEDYYFADVIYRLADLDSLLNDLNAVIPNLPEHLIEPRTVLEQFRALCVRAQLEGHDIYGFCD